MLQYLADHQYLSGILTLSLVFCVMLAWERSTPRQNYLPVHGRRLGNLALLGTDTVIIIVLFPVTAVGTALIAAEYSLGLFNNWQAPWPLAFVVSVLLLDLAIYCQHRLFHAIRWLWPVHRVHHTDLQLDATTGVRFHPVEVIIYTVLKMGVVLALGAPVTAVALFEFMLIAASLFYHANVRIPDPIERKLRCVLITPDVHRIHHSAWQPDTDSNFGNLFTWWDRLFNTYHAAPAEGYENMRIGLKGFAGARVTHIMQLLKQPFTHSATL
ncbi:MAG TPA: sterol desaturase family protein, partial [Gammaproteobacteria bacterium]|nr:sterol desaturase family protein [Gammaproteobacteria bacterium]